MANHTNVLVGVYLIFVSAWALCAMLNLILLIPAQEHLAKVRADIVVSICAVIAAPLFTALLLGSIAYEVWHRLYKKSVKGVRDAAQRDS